MNDIGFILLVTKNKETNLLRFQLDDVKYLKTKAIYFLSSGYDVKIFKLKVKGFCYVLEPCFVFSIDSF